MNQQTSSTVVTVSVMVSFILTPADGEQRRPSALFGSQVVSAPHPGGGGSIKFRLLQL